MENYTVKAATCPTRHEDLDPGGRCSSPLCLAVLSCIVVGFVASSAVLWSGGAPLQAFLAYVTGGWLGLLLPLLRLTARA